MTIMKLEKSNQKPKSIQIVYKIFVFYFDKSLIEESDFQSQTLLNHNVLLPPKFKCLQI